jgi:hypothetical protein
MPQNPEFFKQLSILVKKVLPLIDPAIKKAFLPKDFDDYPALSFGKNGFPSISKYPSRVDISRFFYPAYNGAATEIDLEKFPEFNWLVDTFRATPEWSDYFRFPKRELDADKSYAYFTKNYLESFIERYYYLHGSKFSAIKLAHIYRPAESYLNADKLHFDIAIPILFLKFQPDYFKISDQIIIRKISDEDHRARHRIKAYSPAILDSVFMSATHELVLKDYSYKRQVSFYNYFHFSAPLLYPVDIFETFFTILKLVTDHTSGYAQILLYPKNWAESFYADVKYIAGTVTKSYPHYFEDFYWNRDSYPVITLKQLIEIKKLFNKTSALAENKIKIALKRFYKSMMRQEEEDIIIDLIIALELLLSDGESSEITYKLSMRLTALICKYNKGKYDAAEVFNNVKKIYNFRSAVVHGSADRAQKGREIKLPDDTSVPTIELAKLYLREILKIVIADPRHLEAKTNDLLLVKQ